MSADTLVSDLEAKWLATCKEVGVSDEKAAAWFTTLSGHYSEPGRYYHTLNHIKEMLGWAERYESELQSIATVSLATWFHDVIYNPKAKNSEEQSEELWRQFSKDAGLNKDLEDKVSVYILATKSHKPPSEGDSDLDFFLDFDMVILASDPEAYDTYAKNIRREYIHVPLDMYIFGRSSLLQAFVKQKTFVTPLFDSMYNQKAVGNMQREIERLPSLTDS